MNMILIADSGSTKTDWALVHCNATPSKRERPLHEGVALQATFFTQGITPIHQSPDDIRQILEQELLPQLGGYRETLSAVYFYGSGCTPAHIPTMEQLLKETLSIDSVEVHSDLMAAARALCGRDEGIACILGTGANSCLYDGERMVQNTPALGYILGDEGSGAVLGRCFMNAIFKNPAYAAIREEYLAEQQLTMGDVIQRVYREPMANRFLASTSLYIGRHLDNPLLEELVVDNFRQFFRRNIAPYQRPDLSVHFVGSMAQHYRNQLQQAAAAEGYAVGRVLKSPLEGLVAYHST